MVLGPQASVSPSVKTKPQNYREDCGLFPRRACTHGKGSAVLDTRQADTLRGRHQRLGPREDELVLPWRRVTAWLMRGTPGRKSPGEHDLFAFLSLLTSTCALSGPAELPLLSFNYWSHLLCAVTRVAGINPWVLPPRMLLGRLYSGDPLEPHLWRADIDFPHSLSSHTSRRLGVSLQHRANGCWCRSMQS